ncbi:ERF family protein [Microvirga sp. BSC39]|uniref:ERF family protein n=1 Tax=Microvirga sp. BSC39 TaxID=1549810 RepID=UPI0004E97116|nr:ERF family protein [Microvirga sp. BSC39]KFG68672.1 ERF family protein [Microvirga sp. BSC39]
MSKPSNAVAVQEPGAPVPTVSESAAIIQVIERAAMNPAVDIDKMERLLEMQERIMERNAKSAYSADLARMQPELPVIAERGGIKDRSGNVQSTYALWEDINDAIKPVLSKHGFALSFRTGQDDGRITVTGVLSHREGHSEETTMHLPIDSSGSKNSVQAVGSSISYGKRYTAGALLNITSRGEDDDGKAAGAPLSISEEQVLAIRDLIEAVGANEKRFLQYLKVQSISEIPAKDYQRAIDALNAKKGKQ